MTSNWMVHQQIIQSRNRNLYQSRFPTSQIRQFSSDQSKPNQNNNNDDKKPISDGEKTQIEDSTKITSTEDQIKESSVAQSSSPSSSSPTATPSSSTPPSSSTTTSSSRTTESQQPSTSTTAGYYGATVQRIGSTLTFAERKYEDFEKQIMTSIKESNQRRFRLYFFGSISFILSIVLVFGRPIKDAVTQQTADIAKETLENESLKIQTQELAMAVVQTILNDKEITAHAAAFLKEASTTPETQKALLDLTLHVLQHPQTLDELIVLSKRLLANLCSDKQVVQELADVFIEVLHDPNLQQVVVKVLGKLFQDPEIVQAALNLVITVSQRSELQNATVELLQKVSTDILEDKEIVAQSQQFLSDVMGDDVLQKEGGNALMNTIYHALKPGVIRMVGFGIVCISFAALRLFLSPF